LSLVVSVRPSFLMKQDDTYPKDFHEISHLELLGKFANMFQFWLKYEQRQCIRDVLAIMTVNGRYFSL
jgi:hypothetical protein